MSICVQNCLHTLIHLWIQSRGSKQTYHEIVLYNPYLLLRYDSHINIEVCAYPTAAKYLYKYVTKCNDGAIVTTSVKGKQQARNKVNDYVDLRSFGSIEAAWHLFSFFIN